MQREYLKCASDPMHFLKKYAKIQHPTKGKIKFDLYDYQEKLLKKYIKFRYNIVLKSRQLGISTLSAGHSLWLMMFHQDKNIMVIAKDKDSAKNLVTKVRVMYSELPQWLKVNVTEDNKLSLAFLNGSQIKAMAATSQAGRSEALSLLLFDEAAFAENANDIWTASQQTLATGGNCIVFSTPKGQGNWFHKQWQNAVDENDKNEDSFHTTELPWSVHPERNQAWRDEQTKKLGPQLAAQECDANFLTSGDSVVDPLILQWYKENQIADPVERAGFDKNLWVWEYPDYSKEYIVVADVARGDGSDYSATQVFDVETVQQVAEYKGQLGTTEYGNFLIELSTKYNDALLIIENNNIGWATIQTVIDREYKNLFYQSDDLKYVDVEHQINSNKYRTQDKKMVPGFSTSAKTRPLIIAKMDEYTREKLVNIKSARLIEELFVFIYRNNRPEAMSGYNDDLVMSYAIALWVRDTALKLRKNKDNHQRSIMGAMINMKGGDFSDGFSKPKNKPKDNPFEIQVGNEKEDLTWLLG